MPQAEINAEVIQSDFDEEDIWTAAAVVQTVPALVGIDTILRDKIAEFKEIIR